jgi:hypothetical protein
MVTVYRREPGREPVLSRRALLKGSGAALVLVVTGSAVVSPQQAWGMEPAVLKPETMATLIQMARDIYPHDHVAERFYAIAMKDHDTKSGSDAAHKELIETGIADLDRRAGEGGYRGIGWEDRVKLLHEIEATPFFQTVRGGMVVGFYNQKELWPLFGYEGESFSKGGYMTRGFDDIEWL